MLREAHPGDDLEAWLLLLVDLQSRDDFTQQVGHFLWGALVLLLRPPESVKDVVGDFGEAAQRGDVRVLSEFLLVTEWLIDADSVTNLCFNRRNISFKFKFFFKLNLKYHVTFDFCKKDIRSAFMC